VHRHREEKPVEIYGGARQSIQKLARYEGPEGKEETQSGPSFHDGEKTGTKAIQSKKELGAADKLATRAVGGETLKSDPQGGLDRAGKVKADSIFQSRKGSDGGMQQGGGNTLENFPRK